MELEAQEIPGGSYQIRGVREAGRLNSDDLDLVMTFMNLGDGVAEVSAAMGELDNETNIKLGLLAMQLGFKRLRLHVLKGHKVTRWALFVETKGPFDYYDVDLVSAAATYATDKAL